jgi:hypothetical protein
MSNNNLLEYEFATVEIYFILFQLRPAPSTTTKMTVLDDSTVEIYVEEDASDSLLLHTKVLSLLLTVLATTCTCYYVSACAGNAFVCEVGLAKEEQRGVI